MDWPAGGADRAAGGTCRPPAVDRLAPVAGDSGSRQVRPHGIRDLSPEVVVRRRSPTVLWPPVFLVSGLPFLSCEQGESEVGWRGWYVVAAPQVAPHLLLGRDAVRLHEAGMLHLGGELLGGCTPTASVLPGAPRTGPSSRPAPVRQPAPAGGGSGSRQLGCFLGLRRPQSGRPWHRSLPWSGSTSLPATRRTPVPPG